MIRVADLPPPAADEQAYIVAEGDLPSDIIGLFYRVVRLEAVLERPFEREEHIRSGFRRWCPAARVD